MRPVKEPDLILTRSLNRDRSSAGRWRPLPGWVIGRRAFAGIVFAAACLGIAQDGQPSHPASGGGATTPNASSGQIPPQADSRQSKQQAALATEEQRRKQISDESTQLLAMALALKAEVAKTNKDVLSINVIRKADEIERLAHN